MNPEEIKKNKRLVHFAELRDYIVNNSVKVNIPESKKKKEEDTSLLFFGKDS